MFEIARQDGTKITVPTKIGRYIPKRMCGQGFSGVILIAVDEFTFDLVAIKVIHRQRMTDQRLSREISRELELSRVLSHSNVVNFREVVETDELICIVMDYCECGSLLSVLLNNELSWSELKRIAKQILKGVQYLHQKGIIHGDLKPDNVALTRIGGVKLIDFAYSQPKGVIRDEENRGTLTYAAPELFYDRPYDTEKVDIWALGITFFVMFAQQMPYDEGTETEVMRQICAGRIRYPVGIDLTLRALIRRMTALRPSQRPTIEQVLAHPFFDEVADRARRRSSCAMPLEIEVF
jgi:serine/threonine protein kinase